MNVTWPFQTVVSFLTEQTLLICVPHVLTSFFFYRTILPAFEKCLDDVKRLETVFAEKKDHLKVRYGKYCMNHPKVGYILNEFDVYFNVRDLK